MNTRTSHINIPGKYQCPNYDEHFDLQTAELHLSTFSSKVSLQPAFSHGFIDYFLIGFSTDTSTCINESLT